MAYIQIDLTDYLDELSDDELLKELRERELNVEAQGITLDTIDDVLELLDLGRWREAQDILKIARRKGPPLTPKERELRAKMFRT